MKSRKRRKGENAVFLSNALNLATIETTTFLVDSQRDSPKAVFVFYLCTYVRISRLHRGSFSNETVKLFKHSERKEEKNELQGETKLTNGRMVYKYKATFGNR